jgi:hypothetical protein
LHVVGAQRPETQVVPAPQITPRQATATQWPCEHAAPWAQVTPWQSAGRHFPSAQTSPVPQVTPMQPAKLQRWLSTVQTSDAPHGSAPQSTG